MIYENITYANHIHKSSNNTLVSPFCEIKSNLDKIVHFIVKETQHLHNAVTELDIAKLTSCFFNVSSLGPWW